jgi:hypothetical protein
MEISIILTEAEYKALSYVAVDPIDWVQNAAQARAMAAMEEIFQEEVKAALADPNTTSIPTDREAVVLASTLPSAAERQELMMQQTPQTQEQQAE